MDNKHTICGLTLGKFDLSSQRFRKETEKNKNIDECNIVGKGKTRSKSVIQITYLASWENPQMTG